MKYTIEEKALMTLAQNRVKCEATPNAYYFTIEAKDADGKPTSHSVVITKKDGFKIHPCTCHYGSTTGAKYNSLCSHQLACLWFLRTVIS